MPSHCTRMVICGAGSRDWSAVPEPVAREQRMLTSVEPQFLAVGKDDALEPDDLLTVGKLIADARDHIAGFHRRPRPAVGLHAVDGGSPDQPFLRPSVIGLNLKRHHRVRIGPRELDNGALYRHEPVVAYRP